MQINPLAELRCINDLSKSCCVLPGAAPAIIRTMASCRYTRARAHWKSKGEELLSYLSLVFNKVYMVVADLLNCAITLKYKLTGNPSETLLNELRSRWQSVKKFDETVSPLS